MTADLEPTPALTAEPTEGSLVLHMIISVDGFISDGQGGVNPAAQWDEEVHRFYLETFREARAVVFGRGVFEAYVGHWRRVAAGTVPSQNELELAWARRLTDMPKYVVSATLTSAPVNTRVLSGDVVAKIAELKRSQAGKLLLICGPSLFNQFTRARLIDEYTLFVCPNLMAHGDHLGRELPEGLTLAFESALAFASGMQMMRYRPLYPP
jgi:dihydrofolate reductase